jgi:type II secretory pathway pseudopilin PulG
MNSQKGFSLIEVMMAGVILIMAGMSAAGFAALMSKTNSSDQSKVDLLSVKSQMAQYLANERIWMATVGNSAFGGINNRLFRCFRLMPADANHDCTQGEELQLFSPDTNAILYDGRVASTQGFTAKGQPCNTFNPTTPDPNCPMKFNLSWRAICPVAVPNCAIPQVQINADFIYNNTLQSMSFINDSSSMNRVSFASVVRIRDSANPVAVNDVVYTNLNMPTGAPLVFLTADAQITFDPSVNDYTETGGPVYLTDVIGSVPVTATTRQAMSTKGGTILFDLTTRQMTYTPALAFYGVDSFQYQIQDAYGNTATGTVRIKVMTPYTWTGFASNSNMTDLRNWCGKVVGGTCDGATNLIPLNSSSIGDVLHLVFDDTCDLSCAPLINSDIQIKSMEMRNFTGTISFAPSGTPINFNLGWDNSTAHPGGHQDIFSNKTYDGTITSNPPIQSRAGSFIQHSGVFNGTGGAMLVMGQLVVLGGSYFAH